MKNKVIMAFQKIERKATADAYLSKVSAIFAAAEARDLFNRTAELMEDYLEQAFEILFVEKDGSESACGDPVTRKLAEDFPSLRDCGDEQKE